MNDGHWPQTETRIQKGKKKKTLYNRTHEKKIIVSNSISNLMVVNRRSRVYCYLFLGM